jgi:ADP-dependent NAD(P)H-hydrate dehydratase
VTAPRPLDRGALAAHPLPPVVDGDKESKGRLLVIAGSREVPGAALLAALGAMRAGAGKLCIATVRSIACRIGIAFPEAKVVGLAEDGDALAFKAVEQIAREAAKADAVVAGPGMDEGEACKPIAAALLQSEARLAFDAAMLQRLEPLPPHERSTSPILLPHSGELAALLDVDREAVERDPLRCGLRAAELYRSLVLVKGVTSHVVTPDGQAWTYDGGAPGLGVSGSGDVLAGIVAGLLARGAEPLHALLWAVWMHGEAGAALARKVGPIGFLAREIADEVPALIPR